MIAPDEGHVWPEGWEQGGAIVPRVKRSKPRRPPVFLPERWVWGMGDRGPREVRVSEAELRWRAGGGSIPWGSR